MNDIIDFFAWTMARFSDKKRKFVANLAILSAFFTLELINYAILF